MTVISFCNLQIIFRELLEELPDLHLDSNWKDLKKELKDDPRYTKFSSSDKKCEREFREYLKDKLVAAKADFRELLKVSIIIVNVYMKLHLHQEMFTFYLLIIYVLWALILLTLIHTKLFGEAAQRLGQHC